MDDAAHPLDKLKEVMARLRDPDGGCPWDLEQDFKSIVPYTIEEAYEVADAIENDDMENLREELGDLLFQSVYHAQMASEQGLFTLDDVVNDVTEKMISRHPHVFGDVDADTPDDVDDIWDALKAKEKGAVKQESALDGIPKAFPALLRAQKLQKKAAKTGFEWTQITDVLDKLEEELAEMREAVAQGTIEQKGEELGDILFVLANYARLLGLNSEEVLRDTNNKFERRFRGMEQDLEKEDKVMSALTLDQMTQLWIKQKQKERS